MRNRAFASRAMIIVLVLALASSVRSQSVASISVTGDIPRPLILTSSDFAAMPRAKATINTNGIETVYEGVWLSVVIN